MSRRTPPGRRNRRRAPNKKGAPEKAALKVRQNIAGYGTPTTGEFGPARRSAKAFMSSSPCPNWTRPHEVASDTEVLDERQRARKRFKRIAEMLVEQEPSRHLRLSQIGGQGSQAR